MEPEPSTSPSALVSSMKVKGVIRHINDNVPFSYRRQHSFTYRQRSLVAGSTTMLKIEKVERAYRNNFDASHVMRVLGILLRSIVSM